MLKVLDVNELKPGMMVSQVIEQSGPVKIRKVGMIRSPEMIQGLKEMGVTTVEIDVSQSLDIDTDEDTNDSKATKTVASDNLQEDSSSEIGDLGTSSAVPVQTPTRKMIEADRTADRQAEQVDRQLSQQFHNSLFMPAADEMPSALSLYAKPVGFSALLLLLGLSVGFAVSSSPVWYQSLQGESVTRENSAQLPPDLSTNMTEQNELTQTSPSPQTTASLPQAENAVLNVEPVDSNKGDTAREIQSVSSPADSQSSTNDRQEQQALLANSDRTVSPDTPTQDTNAQSSVNGVVLEEGQQVLGYQSGDSEQSSIEPATENQLQNVETGSVDPDLLRRLNEAIAEIDGNTDNSPTANTPSTRDAEADGFSVQQESIPRIDELSSNMQVQLPDMSFSVHIYASDPRDRWVRVNGQRLEEGDFINNQVEIYEIQSEVVILQYLGQRFSMNALSDW